LQLAFQTLLAVAAMRTGVAGAQPLYWGGGSTDIAADTPLPIDAALLTGTWDASTKNWAATPKPGAYGAFANGADVYLGYYTNKASATVTLAADQQVRSLTACMSLAPDYNLYFGLTAVSPRTLTPVGSNFVVNTISSDWTRRITLLSNVSLAGGVPLEKKGPGGFQVSTDCGAYTGSVRSAGGTFNVDGWSGTLKGVPRFDLAGRMGSPVAMGYGGNDFTQGNLTPGLQSGANDKIGDSALIVLNRGVLDCRGGSTSTETIGRVDLETWGVLGATQGNLGGTLTLSDATAGLTRGSTGLGMVMVPVAAAGTPYTNIRVPNGLPTGVLLPWIAAGRGGFMYVDGTDNNTLKRIPPIEAATDVATWTNLYGAASNVRVGDATKVTLTGELGGSLTLQSLGFFNNAASTLNLGSGNTLTLASGAVAFHPGDYGAHQTITNGALASGTDKLYLHTSDSGSSAWLTIFSPVVGAGLDVVKAGIGGVGFNGAGSNTYGGKTIVSGGGLSLKKTGGAIAVPGPLVVRNGGSVQVAADNQIEPSADVTIEQGGLIYNGGAQTYSGVVKIEGGTLLFPNMMITMNHAATPGLVFNGGWINHYSSHPGGINLQTDVRYESTAATQARFERLYWIGASIAYDIKLNGGNRVFDIADSATLPAGVPEMVVDTAIVAGSPAGGALTKKGAGTLQLTYTNSYAGGTTVDGGTLRVSKITAPAQSGLMAYTLAGSCVVTFTQPVAKDMVVGQLITGTTISASRTVSRVLNDYEIMTDGWNLNGVSTNIAVSAMSRVGSLGTGPATVNDTGTLVIDAGISLANAATVNAGGTIAASGAGLGSLVVDGGTVAVDLDAGALAVSGAVSLANATLTFSGTLGDEPVTLLTAGTSLTGTFAAVNNQPPYSTLRYIGNSVVIAKDLPTLILIR
jgi:autotransporter-associated beta strand protein